jgi:hypothetical protein
LGSKDASAVWDCTRGVRRAATAATSQDGEPCSEQREEANERAAHFHTSISERSPPSPRQQQSG